MADRSVQRGAKSIDLRAWSFGAVGRRSLLDVLLRAPQPPKGWSIRELEVAAGVSNGALYKLLGAAVDLSLTEQENGRFWRPENPGSLAEALQLVLDETDGIPSRPPRPLPRRSYAPRSSL